MNAFIFASRVNHPGKGDASHAFVPGAEVFKRLNDVRQEICYFDYHDKNEARERILHELRTVDCDDPEGLDAVVYFGHGWEHGLSSARFNDQSASYGSAAQVADLARAISMVSKHDVRVIFYACRAGALHDSFARRVSMALNNSDALIFAHELVPGTPSGDGHSFCNPYVTVWDKSHKGRYLIPPHSTHWSAWRREMAKGKVNRRAAEEHPLWAYFPFMSQEMLEEILSWPSPFGESSQVSRRPHHSRHHRHASSR